MNNIFQNFFPQISEITVDELNDRIESGMESDQLLLDVREKYEYESGHINNSLNIPMGEVSSNIEKLKNYSTIYVICNSGSRSAKITSQLMRIGMNVFNLKGGMITWKARGYRVEFDN